MGFGMTGARQAEIQARLFQMAGQGSATDTTSKSTPADVKIPRHQAFKKSSSTGATAEQQGVAEGPGNERESLEDLAEGLIDHDWLISEDSLVVADESGEDWTCQTCTLINTATTEFCMACGIPRF
jgi:hypothetical protein